MYDMYTTAGAGAAATALCTAKFTSNIHWILYIYIYTHSLASQQGAVC